MDKRTINEVYKYFKEKQNKKLKEDNNIKMNEIFNDFNNGIEIIKDKIKSNCYLAFNDTTSLSDFISLSSILENIKDENEENQLFYNQLINNYCNKSIHFMIFFKSIIESSNLLALKLFLNKKLINENIQLNSKIKRFSDFQIFKFLVNNHSELINIESIIIENFNIFKELKLGQLINIIKTLYHQLLEYGIPTIGILGKISEEIEWNLKEPSRLMYTKEKFEMIMFSKFLVKNQFKNIFTKYNANFIICNIESIEMLDLLFNNFKNEFFQENNENWMFCKSLEILEHYETLMKSLDRNDDGDDDDDDSDYDFQNHRYFREEGDGKVVIILDKNQLIQIFYSCNLIDDDILKIGFESCDLIYSLFPHVSLLMLERLKNPKYYKEMKGDFIRFLFDLVSKGNLPVINFLYLNYGDFFSQLAKNEYFKSSKLIFNAIQYDYPQIVEILLEMDSLSKPLFQ
ncbi:hypothetical protein ACTFIY_007533 [Dictyostelium cf. discoideum]